MEIVDFEARFRPAFVAMMADCFIRDYGLAISEEDVAQEVAPHFVDLHERGISPILVALDPEPVGFVIYQVDSPASDWNERQGWGLIREIHVAASRRRQGVAAELVAAAESRLRALGVVDAYLTGDDAQEFWTAMGWTRTTEKARNDDTIYEKRLADA